MNGILKGGVGWLADNLTRIAGPSLANVVLLSERN
jgi:hypothetical protein